MNWTLGGGRAEPAPLRLLVGTGSVVAQGDVFLKYSFTLMWSHGFVLLSKTLLTNRYALNTPGSATTTGSGVDPGWRDADWGGVQGGGNEGTNK